MKRETESPLDHGDEWRLARKKYYENYRAKWVQFDPYAKNAKGEYIFGIFGHVLYMHDANGKEGPCALTVNKEGTIDWTWAHGAPVAYWSF
jgi:hypothetical protein